MMHAIVPNIEPATAPPQLAASADIVEAVLSISFGRLTNQIAIIKDSPAPFLLLLVTDLAAKYKGNETHNQYQCARNGFWKTSKTAVLLATV